MSKPCLALLVGLLATLAVATPSSAQTSQPAGSLTPIRVAQQPQRWGLEWLFRLATEPRRLWRRYLANNPRFVWRLLLQWSGAVRYDLNAL